MKIVHIPTVVAHGEILVDERLNPEVKRSQVRDRGRDRQPLPVACLSIDMDEQRDECHLLQYSNDMRGKERRKILGNTPNATQSAAFPRTGRRSSLVSRVRE